ncbi:uncharacterized protein LOC117322159 [Pecten maximus]|uniref:uncharacterized protein LOC117322159 n=1 Tax=Pecten maximus TaxID=6579 RepID=UPI00145861CF|nr:uncharacterized protein LOC117322159 [Pecten maximus]
MSSFTEEKEMTHVAAFLLCLFVTSVDSRAVSPHLWNLNGHAHVHLSSQPGDQVHKPSTSVDNAPRPLQTYLPIHKGDTIWMDVVLDGIHMDAIPEVFIPMAVLRERKSLSSSVSSRRARDTSVTTYCATPECMHLMLEYEHWRNEHGYPDTYGRWG